MLYPPVTVVIPAYNAARTIERALASIWLQNYPAVEVIIVDDGSDDDTSSRVRKLCRSNCRLIRLNRNSGVSVALNVGIQEARTDYIAFLDADDEWLENKLRKQMPIIEARTEMTMISCGGYFVDFSGNVTGAFGLEQPSYSAGEFWRGLLIKSYIAKPTVIARRAKIVQLGGFSEALKISEDQEMWIGLALAGEVGFLAEPLVRVHASSYSLMRRYRAREDEFGLAMIRGHLSKLASRLTKREIRRILAHRYAAIGRNLYTQGRPWRGACLVLQGVLLGDRPVQNLTYLFSASAPSIHIKRFIRGFASRE